MDGQTLTPNTCNHNLTPKMYANILITDFNFKSVMRVSIFSEDQDYEIRHNNKCDYCFVAQNVRIRWAIK